MQASSVASIAKVAARSSSLHLSNSTSIGSDGLAFNEFKNGGTGAKRRQESKFPFAKEIFIEEIILSFDDVVPYRHR